MERTLQSIDSKNDCLETTHHCHQITDGKNTAYVNDHFCGKPKGHEDPHECASCDYVWRNTEQLGPSNVVSNDDNNETEIGARGS